MAKKKLDIDKDIEDIKELMKTGKLIFGTDITLKALKKGSLKKVYVSSNAPEDIKDDIKTFSEGKVETVELSVPNSELGTVCKKPFVISIIGVRKDESD